MIGTKKVEIKFNVKSINNKHLTNEMLEKLLYNFGPIFVCIDTTILNSFENYGETIRNNFKDVCKGVLKSKIAISKPNHALLLVGYGTLADNTKYWILKNSWSKNWGCDGYCAIQYVNSLLPIKDDFSGETKTGPLAIFENITYVNDKDLKKVDMDLNVEMQNAKEFEINLKNRFSKYAPGRKSVEKHGKSGNYWTLFQGINVNETTMKSVSKQYLKYFSYTYPSHNHLGVVFSGPVMMDQENSLDLMISVKQFMISIIMKLIFVKTGENWCVIFQDKSFEKIITEKRITLSDVRECLFFMNDFLEKKNYWRVGKSSKQLDFQILEEFKEEVKTQQDTMEYFDEDDRVGYPWYWTAVTIIILIFLFVYSNN